MRRFLYAGSFDPFTRGHFDVVLRAVEKYKQGVILIAHNPQKVALFDCNLRVQMIKDSLSYYDRITGKNLSTKVEVVVFDGLTVDAAIKYGTNVLIRGIRNEEDYLTERDLIYFNRKIARVRGFQLNQMHIRTGKELSQISSTAVKQLCAYGEYIVAQQFVLPPVHFLMMKHYLFEVFVKYCLTPAQRATGAEYWEKFVTQMSRPYHNLSHIAVMLNRLQIYQGKVENKAALIRAIFYHDYVADDVAASFQKAKEVSTVCKDDWRLFCATDHFQAKRKLEGDAQLMHDFDLSVLSDKDNYDDYRNNVRLEFGQIDLKEYIEGRLDVLTKLSQVDFYVLGKSIQDKAWSNIRKEINYWENVRRYGLPPACLGLDSVQ